MRVVTMTEQRKVNSLDDTKVVQSVARKEQRKDIEKDEKTVERSDQRMVVERDNWKEKNRVFLKEQRRE
jgi:hypothetical protein